MSGVVQLIGALVLVLAAWLLWGPWALAAGGAVLLVAPELLALRRGRSGR